MFFFFLLLLYYTLSLYDDNIQRCKVCTRYIFFFLNVSCFGFESALCVNINKKNSLPAIFDQIFKSMSFSFYIILINFFFVLNYFIVSQGIYMCDKCCI